MCLRLRPAGCRFIALSYVCLCSYAVVGWDGDCQCHSALCPYTLALYYLIPGHHSLSPRMCSLVKHKHMCYLTNGCSFTFSQAVVVHLHSVCRSVRCAPSPHLHSVQ